MITQQYFDTYEGKEINVYQLSDKIDVLICPIGATVLSIRVPDRFGKKTDVLLSMTECAEIAKNDAYMGSVVGRCANRISNGKFDLNGVSYQLTQNKGQNHLHGGNVGFNQKVFKPTIDGDSLLLELDSPDGEEGYPGNLKIVVRYSVKGSSFAIDYYAASDKDTLFNPTSHLYFNLNGESDGSILDNVVQITADSYLQVDENLIPTEKAAVANTPFDFSKPKPIGQDIDCQDVQLNIAGGYDHNFCLEDDHAACAYSTKSGVCLDVFTDCCGLQFYTGNFLNGQQGKSVYDRRSGFCMETQFFPNAINNSEWKQPVLKAGEKFHSCTQYVFSTL